MASPRKRKALKAARIKKMQGEVAPEVVAVEVPEIDIVVEAPVEAPVVAEVVEARKVAAPKVKKVAKVGARTKKVTAKVKKED